MRTYQLKKEKWHHSSYSIYQNKELIGEYLPERLKRPHKLSLRDRSYTFKKRSVWSKEMELYLGNIKAADIFLRPFGYKATISLFSKGQFIYKKTNSWKNTYTLTDGYKPIGECKVKINGSAFKVGDSVDENLVAAIMFITHRQRQNMIAVIAALVPSLTSALHHFFN